MEFINTLGSTVDFLFHPTTLAFALAAIGLNFHFGLTGLLNMGHAGFMLLGMYGYAITVREGGGLALGVLVAIACAVTFALLLGWPTLRLRGDYLAIVTIAASEMIRYLGRSQSLIGLTSASTGIRQNEYDQPFESLSPFPDKYIPALGTTPFAHHGSDGNSWWLRVVGVILVVIFAYLFWRLSNSPWGRVLKGIREDEDAVRSLGKNVYSYKMQALVIGGVLGALGGVVWAHGASVQPDSMGRPVTFYLWTMLLLGGAAKVFGPILGAMIYAAALYLIKIVAPIALPFLTTVQVEPLSLALVGIALMLLVIFRPQGILGDKRELAING